MGQCPDKIHFNYFQNVDRFWFNDPLIRVSVLRNHGSTRMILAGTKMVADFAKSVHRIASFDNGVYGNRRFLSSSFSLHFRRHSRLLLRFSRSSASSGFCPQSFRIFTSLCLSVQARGSSSASLSLRSFPPTC